MKAPLAGSGAAPPPRSLLVLLVALSTATALAGCERTRNEGCPGETIASLELHGELAEASCVVPPEDGWSPPTTLPADDPAGTFQARFNWDESSGELVYCTEQTSSANLHGTRSGGHLHVEATLPGAVLGACASTCAPLMTVTIDGELTDVAGTRATFSGTLVEEFHDSADSCGACQLPCTSRYTLTGTE